MNVQPRLSIGLPVFNGERFLREALDSILAQTFVDYEVIISDNASTDRTEEICREYAESDKRIRYSRNDTNLGAAKNFNRVFALSSGEYFKWAAADDVLEPDFLLRCVSVLERDPLAVLAYPRVTIIDQLEEASQRTRRCYHRPNLQSPLARERIREIFFATPPSMFVHYLIFGLMRSATLRDTPLIRNYVGSDVCLLVDLALRGKLVEVPEELLHIRWHRDSYTHHVRRSKLAAGKEGLTEVRWFDPTKRTTIILPAWRFLWEHFLSTARCNETLRERIVIAGLLCRATNRQRELLGKELRLAITEALRRRMPFRLVARRLAFVLEKIFNYIMIVLEGAFQIFRWMARFFRRNPT